MVGVGNDADSNHRSFTMKLIKELGPRVRKTSSRTDRWGVFECDICKGHKEYPMSNGNKGIMCVDCRRVMSATKHNMCKTEQYHSWFNMKQRCTNKNRSDYKYYGGKNVSYADKWETFQGFWEDMEKGHFPQATIDRIDNNLGYFKSNCQWITRTENSSKDKFKPVIQYKVEGRTKIYIEDLRVWSSVKEAAYELNLLQSKISAVCRKNRKTHGGFGWKFVNKIQ